MAKTYGYCRISTNKQKIDRQIENIKSEYPRAEIIREEYTGTTTNRPRWKSLNSKLHEGDTVVFDSVSRMSRNAEEGVELYIELYNRGVNLVFLKEPHINTNVYKESLEKTIKLTGTEIDPILKGINEYLNALTKRQIEIAFEQSEKEVTDLQQRTKEGIAVAKRKGKQIGRKPGSTITTKKSTQAKKQIIALSEDFDGQYKDVEILQMIGVSRKSYYKYKREIREELEEKERK